MVAGSTSGDGYTGMNTLSMFSATLVLVLSKRKSLNAHKEMTDSLII